jgi:hypothetical protein
MAAGREGGYPRTMKLSRHACALLACILTLSSLIHSLAAEEPLPPAVDAIAVENARWAEIKDLSYDERETFFSGFKRLETRLDEQISELAARRAAMKGSANTKDWDFAMKELGNARSYLKGTGEVLHKATADTWAQEKEKVGLAWVRAQAASAKVRASTTQ